jgi:hypothetical protein
MVEAVRISEMSVYFEVARRYVLEDFFFIFSLYFSYLAGGKTKHSVAHDSKFSQNLICS